MKKQYFFLVFLVFFINSIIPESLVAQTNCVAPVGLTSTNVSQTGAYLYLSPTSTNTGTFNLQYHISGTTTWTSVNTITMPYQLANLTCGTSYEWKLQQICIASPSGTTNTILSAWSTGSTFTTLACTPTCNAPVGLSTTNVSQTGAVLNWTPTTTVANSYNIHYHAANSTVWTTVNNISMPYQLGNLTCGTAYEWQVQQICSASPAGTSNVILSAWSTGSSFSTLACTPVCNAPTGLTSTNVSQTGAYLYLSPTATNTGTFNLHYHISGATTWTTVNNVSLPYQLSNLNCGTSYEWQVQQICSASPAGTSNVILSAWSTGSAFSTLACTPTCNAPVGLSTTNVIQTGAVLNWTAVSGAYAYIIRYKRANISSANYTTLTSSATSLSITGLTAGSYYVWQVQAVCANSPITSVNNNSWSANATFATPNVLVSPNPANQTFSVSFWADQITNTDVELRDSYGQLVTSQNDMSVLGYNTINIDTTSFSEGLYFITVQNNSDTFISKVFIKH